MYGYALSMSSLKIFFLPLLVSSMSALAETPTSSSTATTTLHGDTAHSQKANPKEVVSPSNKTLDPDTLVQEFIKAAQIEAQLNATFDEVVAEFGGNIKEVKERMAEEMGEHGIKPEEVSRRLVPLEDLHQKIKNAREPLIRDLLNQLMTHYKDNLTPEEIKKLIDLFKDPVMQKLQTASAEFLPEVMFELQTKALSLVAPLILIMQKSIKDMETGIKKTEEAATTN